MVNKLRRIPVCIWLALFAILPPAISWAEASIPLLPADQGAPSQLTVTLGRETELIAARTLAFASTEDPSPVEKREKPTLRPEEGFQSGTWHLGVKSGYGDSHKIFAGRESGVNFAPLFFQIGYTVTDVHGPFPVRGSLEVIFEPTFMFISEPAKTFGEGASILLRYNFVTGTRWVPFFEAGIGILHWNLHIPRDLNSQLNYTILSGPGVNYFLTDKLAITGQVGLHHVSNGGRKSPNVGVNSSMYLLGVEYYF
jgi:hypothetical protein